MRRRRAIACSTLALTLGLCASAAPPVAAQTQQSDASRQAAGALGREAAALVSLGAFGADTARVQQAVGPLIVRDAGRNALVDALDRADEAGQAALSPLVQAMPTTSPDVRNVLARLSAQDRAAAEAGRPISIGAEVYLRGLDHLVRYGGAGPRTPAPPDAQLIANALAGITEPDTGDSGSSPLPLVAGGIVALGVLLGAVIALRRRATPASNARPSPTITPTAPVTPPRIVSRPDAASMHDLLEVSRRLTAAASAGNVDRLIVRHALDLVRSDGAALVRVDDTGGLRPSAESHADLLVASELPDSGISRVAETGQTLVQASASDRAIRNVPAAMAAVPLVGGGRVLAVLVVVRRVHEPFSPDERNVLEALAPVAAAAMHNAAQSQAAVETSLADALTGTGNRRRFDADLARALEDAQGATSLIIVDLDHFKSVNDTYGHQAGDTVLRIVASVLKTQVRPGDTVYRFGGEEFCVLLPDTQLADASDVAERLRQAIEQTAFRLSDAESIERTASFGVATTSSPDGADLIARADAALYEAKSGGRNAVRVDRAQIS